MHYLNLRKELIGYPKLSSVYTGYRQNTHKTEKYKRSTRAISSNRSILAPLTVKIHRLMYADNTYSAYRSQQNEEAQ